MEKGFTLELLIKKKKAKKPKLTPKNTFVLQM